MPSLSIGNFFTFFTLPKTFTNKSIFSNTFRVTTSISGFNSSPIYCTTFTSSSCISVFFKDFGGIIFRRVLSKYRNIHSFHFFGSFCFYFFNFFDLFIEFIIYIFFLILSHLFVILKLSKFII